MKKSILIIFLLLTNSFYGQKNICQCQNENMELPSVPNSIFDIKICGNQDTEDSLMYGLTIFDCRKHHFLINNSDDEIWPNSIEFADNGFKVLDYQFVPQGDNWEQTIVPSVETTFSYQPAKEWTIEERIVFSYPELSESQKNDILQICAELEANKKSTKIMYPLDHESIYILFVGAYKNIGTSRNLLIHLRDYFELDGAVAETYDEIPIETLIKNRK